VSATRLVMAQEMTPRTRTRGERHGGNIMRLADSAAGVVAIRHSGRNCVTAAVDHFEFHAPVFIGNLVTFHASVNHVGRTSMEVGVRVEAEEPRTGKKTHTNSSYFLMVRWTIREGRSRCRSCCWRPRRTAEGTRRQ